MDSQSPSGPRSDVVEQAELFATRLIAHQNPEKMVFHDIRRTHQVVRDLNHILEHETLSAEDQEVVRLAAWLVNTGYQELPAEVERKPGEPLSRACLNRSMAIAGEFLASIAYPAAGIERVREVIRTATFQDCERGPLGKILVDAIYACLGGDNAKDDIKLLYEEVLLTGGEPIDRSSWYDTVIEILTCHRYYTDYARREFEPKKQKLILHLQKDRKKLEKQQDVLLKRELAISDEELKELKKNLASQQGRDARGIQTLFRTTSKNHYTLNTMVDRKAGIMISVNSIILSLIVGGVIGKKGMDVSASFLPALVLGISSAVSIFYAVLSIIPAKTHGEFTEDEIRNKSGNLLYFGNFHSMHPRDFEWGVLQMLNDSSYLYSSMIRDLYYLGRILKQKYRRIRVSLMVFVVGIIAAFLVALVQRIF